MTSASGEGGLPESASELRASDDDRQRTIALLRRAAGEGCIDLDELEHRIEATYDARTRGDLDAVTSDLPATISPPPPARSSAAPPAHRNPLVLEDDEFRGHLTVYCLVIGMLIGIWLLGGAGHFWPFYPAAGWGIGLGSHYQRAASHQRKRLARATAEGITLEELERREAAERKQKRAELAQRVLPPHSGAPPRVPPDPLGLLSPKSSRDGRTAADPASRFVVAMFVDIVGSTSLNEALGDQHWVRVRSAFREQVRECAEAHSGWEANTSGDGVLVRFHHPASAARAATDILRRLDRQRTETGFAPSVRIGIHSGDAVEEGDDILGNVVNLAARVSDAADVDEILVTEHVADHLDGRHTTTGRGLHTLKGIARPRHLLALVWR